MKETTGENVGIVYTETVVHAAPPQFVADAPYQIAIIEEIGGNRITARIEGDRVTIGNRVVQTAERDGVSYYKKAEPDV